MYNIYVENTCVYDDRNTTITDYVLINPKLEIEDNYAGSLSFKVPLTHPLYSTFDNCLRKLVKVFNDDVAKPIWVGRILSVEENFTKTKEVFCEGALAFLNDCVGQDDTTRLYGTLPTADDQGIEVAKVWLNYALRGYNNISWTSGGETHTIDKVDNKFKIQRGAVTVSIPEGVDSNGKARPYHDSTAKTCYQKVLDLQKAYGGHIQTDTNSNGSVIVLNWYKDFWGEQSMESYLANAKEVRLGDNLLDLEKTMDVSEIFTVLLPYGEEKENPLKDSYTDATPTRNAGYYLTKSGTFSTASDNSYTCSNTIEIDSQLDYYYTGAMKAQGVYGAYYAVLDEAGRSLYVKVAKERLDGGGNYEVTTMKREKLEMPPSAKYIRLCWYIDGSTTPKLETKSPNADDISYVNVSSLVHSDSPDLSPYITVNSTLFNRYGWIEKVVHFDNVNMAEGLYQVAKKYISSLSFLEQSIEVKYIDLGIIEGNGWSPPKLYEPLHVISEAHGIDTYLFVTRLNIPMDKPQDMTVTVGGSLYRSLTRIVGNSMNK